MNVATKNENIIEDNYAWDWTFSQSWIHDHGTHDIVQL